MTFPLLSIIPSLPSSTLLTNPIIPSMTISSVLSTILTISGGGDDDNSDGGVGNGGDDIRIFGGDGYYDSERTIDDNSYHTYWLLARTTVLLAAVASTIGVKMSKIPSTPALASIPTSSSSISTSFNDKIRRLSGGALQSLENDKKIGPKGILNITPKALSVINMAVAMSLHYLSYSLARPTTIALFTSKDGFGAGNYAAFTLAMAFISPVSFALLLLYNKILESSGPKYTLQFTTYLCASVIGLSSVAVHYLRNMSLKWTILSMTIKPFQLLVGMLFIFRESYVQLLTSQYWSFMSSIVDPLFSAKYFAPVSGLTSLTSALAGANVGRLSDKFGLEGVLGMAALVLICSSYFASQAYVLADKHGFNPTNDNKHTTVSKTTTSSKGEKENTPGLLSKATDLFQRVPVLKGLFIEILAGQGLTTLLNVCFVTKVSQSIPDDNEKAGWMGKFFAAINAVSCALQFGVIPTILPLIEPRVLWRFMPIVMTTSLTYLASIKDPSLYLISGLFMLMKTMEFAIRRTLDEMIYVPLDYDSRFLGKEIISVLGYRFGKSGMSLALSLLTRLFGNFDVHNLSQLTTGASVAWLAAAWNLSNLIPSRSEAKDLYDKNKVSSDTTSTMAK